MSEVTATAPEFSSNINAAEALCFQLMEAGFTYGCLEVALTALGASFTLEEVERIDEEHPKRSAVIDQSGFNINWIVSARTDISAQDIDAVFGGKIDFDEECPDGEVAGYILSETYPQKEHGHSIAIIPDPMGTYSVMDSAVGSRQKLTAENLAQVTHYIVSNGGSFEILQLKRKTDD